MNVRAQVAADLSKALEKLGVEAESVELARTADPNFGDFATNAPLKHSHKLKQSPMEFANILSNSLGNLGYLEKLEVKEPGFVNFFIKPEFWQKEVGNVLKEDVSFGSNKLGSGKKARVEFVSANPTGPLHFGNARGGPIGDCLASVLEFSGWEVMREYINNDEGNQITELGKTLAAKAGLVRAKEEELTYKGEYTNELAKVVAKKVKSEGKSEDEIVADAGRVGVELMFAEIIKGCEAMGIKFDYIVSESDLRKKVPAVLADFEKKGLLVKKDDAIWFSPKNEFLEDREAVVVKSDGNYTYFTADIVYHKEKFESGYDLVVDVFGSNTSGHVPKLQALASVVGFDLDKFKVILYQFVRIKRGAELVKMSKRAGNFVTAKEVLEEVGRDALRFFILMHDANSHIDFDLELAKQKSSKNPVYYVQYAGARIASILEKAGSEYGVYGIEYKGENKHKILNTKYNILTTDYELALIKQITKLPELVEDVSQNFGVHALTRYALDLADTFHKFYENCPVLDAEDRLKEARVALLCATQIALVNTLKLLGVSSPKKM